MTAPPSKPTSATLLQGRPLPERPPRTPLHFWAVVAGWGVVGVWLVISFLSIWVPALVWYNAGCLPAFVLGWAVDVVGYKMAQRRDWRLVLANDFMLCGRCRYPLKGLAPEGVCPECMTAYSPDALARFWWEATRIKSGERPVRTAEEARARAAERS